MKKILVLIFIVSVVLAGCSAPEPDLAPAAHSIQGVWEYTLYTENEGSQNEYDLGTITFTGSDNNGEFVLLNFYEIEYEGVYTVEGDSVLLDSSQRMTGTFSDASHMSGAWTSVDNSDSGTWTAVRP